MLIRLDPVRIDGDASDVAAVTQGVTRSWYELQSGLRSSAGMAGDDPGAEEWGLAYDTLGPLMNDNILMVAQVLKGFEGLLSLTARTYNNVELYGAGQGDNASGIDLPADLYFDPSDIPLCIGAGAPGFLGDMQDVLESALHAVGVVFPTGDTDKLRAAVNPWLDFAQDLTAARTQLSSALGGVHSSQLSHTPTINRAATDVDQILKDMALCAIEMATQLNTIATSIDNTWHELQTMAWNLALEIAIEIGIGVALSFVTFGAGAVASALVVGARVATWAVHASAVIRRLAAILRVVGGKIDDFYVMLQKFRTGGFFWRAGYQAGSSSVAAISASFGADTIMGNEISSEQAWAYVLGGLAGGVGGGAAGAGISMLNKLPNNALMAMGGGAVEGMVESVAGGFTSSAILGQEFNLGQSLLTGGIGGAAMGGIGHGIETKFGTGTGGPSVANGGNATNVEIDVPDTNVQLDLDTNGTGGAGTPEVSGSVPTGPGGTGAVPTGSTSTVADIGTIDLGSVTSTTQLDGLPTVETSTPETSTSTTETSTTSTTETTTESTTDAETDVATESVVDTDAAQTPEVDTVVNDSSGEVAPTDITTTPQTPEVATEPTVESATEAGPRTAPSPEAIGRLEADFPAPTNTTSTVQISVADGPSTNTPFASRTDLAPNTKYEVEGRGTFYTDASGKITYVETQFGGKGNLNPDLKSPVPDATYRVNDNLIFETGPDGGTVSAHAYGLHLGDGYRSSSIQGRIGDIGGTGYDGGHLIGRATDGGTEDINLMPMLESVNRGAGDSFFNLENLLRAQLKVGADVDLHIDLIGGSSKNVPDSIEVRYAVDGVRDRDTFFNTPKPKAP